MQTERQPFDVHTIKKDFPILTQQNRGKPLVYLDSAASAQKPKQVIDAISTFYSAQYANIHRGIYELSECATAIFEDTRQCVAQFIHAKANEIVFVKSTTEAINLVAQSYARTFLTRDDEVIISEVEHHSNIVPWHLLREQIGIVVKVAPIHADGSIDLVAYEKLFTPRTKFVSLSHVSNALGTVNPVAEMAAIAHRHHAKILIDGAQAAPHLPINVQDLDCDFYAFSSHKLYGPTGIGVLYGKHHLLEAMPPYQGGGDMIETVSFSEVTYAPCPQKFEAGTPDIASVAGLQAAIRYVNDIGFPEMIAHEQALLTLAEKRLQAIPGLIILGTARPKVGLVSFVINGIHPHDIGTVLDHEGIAVRAGHHCAMPLMNKLKVPATVRASFGLYSQEEDIEKLFSALLLAKRLFA